MFYLNKIFLPESLFYIHCQNFYFQRTSNFIKSFFNFLLIEEEALASKQEFQMLDDG